MCADETRCPLVAACCPPERAAVSEHRDNSTLVVAGDATSPNDLTTQTTKHAFHLGLTATTGCCARRRGLSPTGLRDHRGKSGSCTLHRHAIVFSVRLQATVAANDSFRHHISASPSGGTRAQPQFQVYVLVGPVGNCNWRNQLELHTNDGGRVPSSLSAWGTRVKRLVARKYRNGAWATVETTDATHQSQRYFSARYPTSRQRWRHRSSSACARDGEHQERLRGAVERPPIALAE